MATNELLNQRLIVQFQDYFRGRKKLQISGLIFIAAFSITIWFNLQIALFCGFFAIDTIIYKVSFDTSATIFEAQLINRGYACNWKTGEIKKA